MNEFRESLKDQTAKYLPRAEYDIQHQRMIEDIKSLRESRASLEGKASQKSMFIILSISIISLIISIVKMFM